MPTTHLHGLMRFCTRPQETLPGVPRWGSYLKQDPAPRLQSTMEHTHGILLLTHYAVNVLRPYFAKPLDSELLLLCVTAHDHGEGELGHDTLDPLKTDESEIAEYFAFANAKEMCEVDAHWCETVRRAYLLQFVSKGDAFIGKFPEKERGILRALAQTHETEAYLFAGLEQLDYVLYALESHGRQVDKILHNVLERQMPKLKAATKRVPGFGIELWTEECTQRAEAFLRGEPIELGT